MKKQSTKKFYKKYVAGILSAAICATSMGAITPSIVQAAEPSAITDESTQGFNPNLTLDENLLKSFGLTDSQIKEFNNYEMSGLYVKNGVIVDENGAEARGKFTAIVKTIRKLYNKLPDSVKKLIAKYTNLDTLLGLIEHYTGTIEDAIYNACITVGMPDWAATLVTKTIMLLIF